MSFRKCSEKSIKIMPKASAEKEWKFSMLPKANVFHPTLEEFANPLKYISSIREVAKTTGI